jgi:hypothetical protein
MKRRLTDRYHVTDYTKVTLYRDAEGALKLFKVGVLNSDEPAEFSDQIVMIKCEVHIEPTNILVGVPVASEMLDWGGLEDYIARAARAQAARFLTIHSREQLNQSSRRV